MLNDLGNTLLRRSAADGLIQEKVNNTVGDETPVLHGTLGEIGNSNLVHLWEREIDAKHLFVKCQGLGSQVERESTVLNVLSGWGVHANGHTEVVGLNVVELTNDEGHKVSRHLRGLVEGHSLLGPTAQLGLHLSLRSNVHVADARQLLISNECDGKFCLEGRLIKAREGATGIRWLHLCHSQDALGTILSLVGRAVEAGHLVVQLAGEADLQLGLGALGDAIVEGEGADLGGLVVRDGRRGAAALSDYMYHGGGKKRDQPDGLPVGSNLGAVDVKLQSVEGDGLGVLCDVEVDHHSAVKGELVKVGLKSDVVVPGHHVGGQQLAGLHVDRAGLIAHGLRSAHVVASIRAVANRLAGKTQWPRKAFGE